MMTSTAVTTRKRTQKIKTGTTVTTTTKTQKDNDSNMIDNNVSKALTQDLFDIASREHASELTAEFLRQLRCTMFQGRGSVNATYWGVLRHTCARLEPPSRIGV